MPVSEPVSEPVLVPALEPDLGKALLALLGDVCLPPPLFDCGERCVLPGPNGGAVSLAGGGRAVRFLRPKALLAAPLELQVTPRERANEREGAPPRNLFSHAIV